MHPLPKALGPTFPLVSALTSTRPSARNTAGGSDLPASWRLILTLGRSPEGPSKGLGAPTLGIGNLRTPALDSPCSPPPPGPLGAPPVIQARERVGPSEPLASFEGRQRQNTWAHAPTHQRPPLGPPPPSPHRPWILPAGLLGANPNPRSAPKGLLPRGLAPQCQGLGTPAPALDSPSAPPPPGPLLAPLVIQGGRMCRAHRAPGAFRRPPRQTLGPPLPLLNALSSACPSARCTSSRSGLQASWGLTLTLGGLLRGPSQGAWRPNAWDWGPETQRWTHPPPHRHPGRYWRRLSSGRQNGQGPRSPQRPWKAPGAKMFGPRLLLASALTPPAPPLAAQPAFRACRHPAC